MPEGSLAVCTEANGFIYATAKAHKEIQVFRPDYILAVWTKLVIPLLFEKMVVCLFLIFLYYESTKLTWIAKYRNDIILFVGIEESMKLGTFHIVRCLIMFFKYALLNDVEVQ